MSEVDYILGHGDPEVRRLELQAALFAPGTERILRASGLGPGMRVLDIGSGAGDVAMAVGTLVGPSGTVLGIDREASVLGRARARAAEAKLDHIRFVPASLDTLTDEQPFDVVLARYVLIHQPDQAAFLKKAASFARPGGMVLVIEAVLPELDSPDATMGEVWSHPTVPLFEETCRQILVACALGRVRVNSGGRLVGLFHEAGLPEPAMLQEVPTAGAGSAIIQFVCLTLRSVLPVLEKHGITSAAEIGIETLEERIQAAVKASHSQIRLVGLVGAWATVS